MSFCIRSCRVFLFIRLILVISNILDPYSFRGVPVYTDCIKPVKSPSTGLLVGPVQHATGIACQTGAS